MSRRHKQRLGTAEEKRNICRQTLASGVSVAQVARRYALNSNLIFKWLKDPRFTPLADEFEAAPKAPLFLPVDVHAEPVSPPVLTIANQSDGEIEIALTSGHRVKVRGAFDDEALARLLKSVVQL